MSHHAIIVIVIVILFPPPRPIPAQSTMLLTYQQKCKSRIDHVMPPSFPVDKRPCWFLWPESIGLLYVACCVLIGMENLQEVEIPVDVQQKLQQSDEALSKQLQEEVTKYESGETAAQSGEHSQQNEDARS